MKNILKSILLSGVCFSALKLYAIETSAEGKLKIEQITLGDELEPAGLFLDMEINSELYSSDNFFLNLNFNPTAYNDYAYNEAILKVAGAQFGIPDRLELFVGNQLFEWGSADGFNPTDVINAQDYTKFILYSTRRRKLPKDVLAAKFMFEPFELSFVYSPDYEADKLPPQGSPWAPALYELFVGDGLADVSLNANPTNERYKDSEYATRLVSRFSSFDLSLMYHWGVNRFPIFEQTLVNNAIVMQQVFRPRNAYGADLTFTVDRFGFRLESLYQVKNTYNLDSKSEMAKTDPDGLITADELSFVAGVDSQFFSTAYVNLQFIFSNIYDSEDDASREDLFTFFGKYMYALELRDSFMEDSLTLSLTSIWDEERNGYYFVPKAKYALTDSTELIVKANLFGGSDDSVFGLYKDNSGAFIQVIQYF